MILNLYKSNQIKRILAFCLVLVLVFTSFSDDYNKAHKAQAVAAVDDATYLAVTAFFLISAGLVFASTGDLQKACTAFTDSCVEAGAVIGDMAGTVSNGVLTLSSDWATGVGVIWNNIQSYFSAPNGSWADACNYYGAYTISVFPMNGWPVDTVLLDKIGSYSANAYVTLKLSDYYDLSALTAIIQANAFAFDGASISGVPDRTFTLHRAYAWDIYKALPFICQDSNTVYVKNNVNCYKYYCYLGFVEDLGTVGLTYKWIGDSSAKAISSAFYMPTDTTEFYQEEFAVPYTDGQTLAPNQDVLDATTSALTKGNVAVDLGAVGITDAIADALTGTGTASVGALTQEAVVPAAIAAELEGTVNPPVEYDGDYKVPTGLASKFPFCIPFDLISLFTVLNATSEVPRFEIPVDFSFIGYNDPIVLDFTPFESVAEVIRWCMIISFLLLLIYITREMIGG